MLLRRLLPSATAATASSYRRPLQQQRVRTLAAASQGGGGGGAEADPAQHCLDLVKTHDYETYLCGLLVPTSARCVFNFCFLSNLPESRDALTLSHT